MVINTEERYKSELVEDIRRTGERIRALKDNIAQRREEVVKLEDELVQEEENLKYLGWLKERL